MEAKERRLYRRAKPRGLVYIKCDPDNGGILMDVSEGGIRFQVVSNVTIGDMMKLRFKLPGMDGEAEGEAQIVWLNDSRKGGGLHFVGLSDHTHGQIKKWLSPESLAEQPKEPASTAPALGAHRDGMGLSANVVVAPGKDSADRNGKLVKTPYSDALGSLHSVPFATPAARRVEVVPSLATSLAESAPEIERRVPLTGIPESETRAVSYLVPIAIGFGIILFALLAFRSRGAVEVFFGSQATQRAAEQPAQGLPHDFQVEVLDLNNKRWVLTDFTSGSNPLTSQVATPQTSPRVAAAVPLQPAADAQHRLRPQLTLQAPRVRSQNPSPTDRQEVGIADSLAQTGSTIDPHFAPESASPAPPPPIQAPGAPAQSSSLQGAVLIKGVQPFYPPVARQLRLQGTVQVQASIDREGVPHELKVLSGDPRLAGPALDAVRQWRYRPAMLDGQPVESEATIQVEFRFQAN
jgi:TonB family protein